MSIDYKALVEKYDTPLYMYDFDYIENRYNRLKEAFSGKKSLINYAVKANSNLSVIQHLAKLGAGADCVSIGEVRRALDAGVDKYKIIFSGVGKRDDEIEEALERDILMLNLESEAEMKRVEMVAKQLGKEARISIRVTIKIDIKFFDVGGGIGVVYDDETPIVEQAYVDAIAEATKGLDLTLACEPGRYMVANAGAFFTRVLYEKNNGGKRFVIVDGGMNDLIRPSLYNDFFGKNVPLPPLQHNDILVVHSAGAYGFTMASNYNTRPKPAEVALQGGDDRLIRRRETYEDQVRLEKEFLR